VEPGFGTRTRVVALSGAAHFDVSGGARTPFVVRTGAVVTRVLGTIFTVTRYPEDAGTRVAVVAGKVLVGAETPWHPSMVLAAHAAGIVTDSSATLVTTAAQDTSWTSGRLVFHKAPTADVLAALTRWYGYQFRLTDSVLARQNLTVGISTESASAALATLKLALGADLSYADGVITLSPHRGTPRAVPKIRDGRDVSPPIREVGR
jgi:ferric-dicitrate binding protein FerR (iron transport regulator)